MFDTERFVDVSNDKQQKNGTLMFRDTKEPNVYYLSYSSGYVVRLVKTKTIVKDFKTDELTITNNNKSYQINVREFVEEGGSSKSVLLPKLNDRLSRIQKMAEKYKNRSLVTKTQISPGESCTLTIPNID